MTIRRFTRIWEGLIEPAWIGDARERHLSRILNVILLVLLLWGLVFEVLYRVGDRPFGTLDRLMLTLMGVLSLAYLLNHWGYFSLASLLTHTLFITSAFAFALALYWRESASVSVLYYLIVPILMGELFFSMQGYLVSTVVILAGVLGFSLLNPNAATIFIFLFVFCTLIGFSSYNRRLIDQEQRSLTQRFEHEQFLLAL